MPMQFLSATQSPNGSCSFSVWLDTTQGTATDPNPAYVRDYTFGPPPVVGEDTLTVPPTPIYWTSGTLNGVTYTSWPAYCAAEVQLLAVAALAAILPVSPTPTTLTAIAGITF